MAVELQEIVGQNIRRYRKMLKMTQDVLADQLFMDRAAISRYENGTNGTMGIDVLLRFSTALSVTPNDLMTEKKKEEGSVYRLLNPENQVIANKMMEGLLLQQNLTM